MKSKVDKLDVDKLVSVPVDLSEKSYVVKKDLVKKTEYNKLVKVNNNKTIDASKLVKKADNNTKVNGIENKIIDHNHDKYILLLKNLKNIANFANKDDIVDFVKETDFGNKLISSNKRINSNKTKHILVENELN